MDGWFESGLRDARGEADGYDAGRVADCRIRGHIAHTPTDVKGYELCAHCGSRRNWDTATEAYLTPVGGKVPVFGRGKGLARPKSRFGFIMNLRNGSPA